MKKIRLITILQCQQGTTATEFALVAPVLLLMTIGVIEISLMMLSQNILESATFTASRLGKTGYVEDGMSREETIMQVLEDSASGLLDLNRVTITSQAYNEFGDVGSPEPFTDANGNGVRDVGENYTDVNENGQYDTDMGVAGAGGAGEVVVYVVTYAWHVTTPIMDHIVGNEGVFNLTARSVVKNEPF